MIQSINSNVSKGKINPSADVAKQSTMGNVISEKHQPIKLMIINE